MLQNASMAEYAQLIADIEQGWLDRVEAMFAAPSKAARNRIAKEPQPSATASSIEIEDEEE